MPQLDVGRRENQSRVVEYFLLGRDAEGLRSDETEGEGRQIKEVEG